MPLPRLVTEKDSTAWPWKQAPRALEWLLHGEKAPVDHSSVWVLPSWSRGLSMDGPWATADVQTEQTAIHVDALCCDKCLTMKSLFSMEQRH